MVPYDRSRLGPVPNRVLRHRGRETLPARNERCQRGVRVAVERGFELGRGAEEMMGGIKIYPASDTRLDRKVAIKFDI